jgi:hypothetical protein
VWLQSWRAGAGGATVLAMWSTCAYSPGEEEQAGIQFWRGMV